jgi:hypothetical protein
LLFVPVSGAYGMGEYARSLAIAQAAKGRWPDASILFVLSREAPYAASAPFPTALLDSSPTFHSAAVAGLIEKWRPDAVLFDNAGRTAQLHAARRCGARVVYISARRRQRYKAFRLRWMRVIDEHWIAYPRFIAGDLTFLERLKLRYLRRPHVRFLDVVLARRPARGAEGGAESILGRLGCVPGRYTLVVPGGGTNHPGTGDAMMEFVEAARALASAGEDTVFVGRAPPRAAGAAAAGTAAPAAVGPATPTAAGTAAPAVAGTAAVAAEGRLHLTGPLPQSDLAELMAGARLVVTNGGSTLLQAIACGRACVAVPIAGDQAQRIRRCALAGAAAPAALEAAAIGAAAFRLLRDDPARAALAARATALGLTDGVEAALGALASLVDSK